MLCDAGRVEPRHLPKSLVPAEAAERDAAPAVPGSTIAELERWAILKTLEACRGSTSRAAAVLGISPRKIQYKLHQYAQGPGEGAESGAEGAAATTDPGPDTERTVTTGGPAHRPPHGDEGT